MAEVRDGYRIAFCDWLACAVRGSREPAAVAARTAAEGTLGRVAAAGAAGHALDFDDTYLPGLAHLSAANAPVALVLGAERDLSIGEAGEAFAAGFEAMGAVARASHPALYDGGWHPTAVCGVVGAAVCASRLLGLDRDRERAGMALALLRSGGLRSAFGSHGKCLQVGMAAAAGLAAARLAAAGAQADLDQVVGGAGGFEESFGATWAEPDGRPCVAENWIKPWPCCLQTHAPIAAALEVGDPQPGRLRVAVHPVSLLAAPVEAPENGLQAKFSIAYLTGYALLRGPPRVESFDAVDPEVAELAAGIEVVADPALAESEAVLSREGAELVRIAAAPGSAQRPLEASQLEQKWRRPCG